MRRLSLDLQRYLFIFCVSCFLAFIQAAPSLNFIYSSYFGGNGQDNIEDIWIDNSGNYYFVGTTNSNNFPLLGNTYKAKKDAFYAKLTGDGTFVFGRAVGGSEDDTASGIAGDNAGNIYMIGSTNSNDFPKVENTFKSVRGSKYDSFVIKFSASTGSILFSGYYGGSDDEYGVGIVYDIVYKNLFIVGRSTSTSNMPSVSPPQDRLAGGQIFLMKMSTNGAVLISSTFGATTGTDPTSITTDFYGNPVVGGSTTAANFQIKNQIQNTRSGAQDGILMQFGQGLELKLSSYIGGSNIDAVNSIAGDQNGLLYITGYTRSTDFATGQSLNGIQDAFMMIINPNPSLTPQQKKVSSKIFGGKGTDTGTKINVTPLGKDIMISGSISGSSDEFPLVDPLFSSSTESGGFILRYNNNGNIVSSSFIGGSTQTIPMTSGIRLTNDYIILMGSTNVQYQLPGNGAQTRYGGGATDSIIEILQYTPNLSYSEEVLVTSAALTTKPLTTMSLTTKSRSSVTTSSVTTRQPTVTTGSTSSSSSSTTQSLSTDSVLVLDSTSTSTSELASTSTVILDSSSSASTSEPEPESTSTLESTSSFTSLVSTADSTSESESTSTSIPISTPMSTSISESKTLTTSSVAASGLTTGHLVEKHLNVTIDIDYGTDIHECKLCGSTRYVCSNDTDWNQGTQVIEDPRISNPNAIINNVQINMIRLRWCSNFTNLNLQIGNQSISRLFAINSNTEVECRCDSCETETNFISDTPIRDWNSYPIGQLNTLSIVTDGHICVASVRITFSIKIPSDIIKPDESVAKSNPPLKKTKMNKGLLAGIIVGTVVFLVILFAVIAIIVIKRRQNTRKKMDPAVSPSNQHHLQKQQQQCPNPNVIKSSDDYVPVSEIITPPLSPSLSPIGSPATLPPSFISIVKSSSKEVMSKAITGLGGIIRSNSSHSNNNNVNNNININIYSSKEKDIIREILKEAMKEEVILENNKKLYNAIPELTDITIKQKLGEGNFSDIYFGTWNGTSVALKKLKEKDIEKFQNEAITLFNSNHPHIVHFLGKYVDPKDGGHYIVTEYIAKGNLKNYLEKEKNNLKFSDLLDMIIGACKGMVFLSSKKIVHSDLGVRNLLISVMDGTFVVKISDFGLSRIEAAILESDQPIPVKWCAPEVFQGRTFNTQSDIYSFGVVMWEVLSFGAMPYGWLSHLEAAKIILKKAGLPQPDDCPDGLWEIIQKCWKLDPTARIPFAELLKELYEFREIYERDLAVSNRTESRKVIHKLNSTDYQYNEETVYYNTKTVLDELKDKNNSNHTNNSGSGSSSGNVKGFNSMDSVFYALSPLKKRKMKGM